MRHRATGTRHGLVALLALFLLGAHCNDPIATVETEVCDGVDNDLDGIVDDSLNTSDQYENNGQCTPGTAWNGWLGQVGQSAGIGGPNRAFSVTSARIYRNGAASPAGDVDWFRLRFAESDGCALSGYAMTFTLVQPSYARLGFCVKSYDLGSAATVACGVDNGSPENTSGGFTACGQLQENGNYRADVVWNERCELDDSRTFDVKVFPITPSAYSCQSYQLLVDFTALGQGGLLRDASMGTSSARGWDLRAFAFTSLFPVGRTNGMLAVAGRERSCDSTP